MHFVTRSPALTILVVGVVAAASIVLVRTASDHQQTPQRQELSLSWAQSYESLGEMSKAAPFIVLGRVERAALTERHEFSSGALDGGILPFTDFQVHLIEVLKGEVTTESITVRQTGGIVGGIIFEAVDDPLLETGAEYVLYLRYDPSGGRYFVVGGPDGRLKRAGETASSLSQALATKEISDLQLRAVPLSQVRAAAQSGASPATEVP